jgi:hypothetical protein
VTWHVLPCHLLRLTYRFINFLNGFTGDHFGFGTSLYHISITWTRTNRLDLPHKLPSFILQFPITGMTNIEFPSTMNISILSFQYSGFDLLLLKLVLGRMVTLPLYNNSWNEIKFDSVWISYNVIGLLL